MCAKAVGIDENQSIMIPVSLSVHLHLSVSSSLAFSLPQSYCLNPLCSPTAPSSEGAEAAPPQGMDLALLSKFGVNAIPCRRYNPSVKPTACQLPLHRGAEKCAPSRSAAQGSRGRPPLPLCVIPHSDFRIPHFFAPIFFNNLLTLNKSGDKRRKMGYNNFDYG